MADDGAYEYECMRAELLGAGKPDYADYQRRRREAADAEEAAVEAAELEAAETQTEALTSVGGKLDELNSILSATQKRLGRFKVRCGSVTELIKTKLGTTIAGNAAAEVAEDVAARPPPPPPPLGEPRSQLSRAMDNHVDKLDALLDKAERAELSLGNQNKQIRHCLK